MRLAQIQNFNHGIYDEFIGEYKFSTTETEIGCINIINYLVWIAAKQLFLIFVNEWPHFIIYVEMFWLLGNVFDTQLGSEPLRYGRWQYNHGLLLQSM